MSLRIHPQWTYARNVITRTLTPGAPDGDAVCEEVEHLNDVLDPQRFYAPMVPDLGAEPGHDR